MMIQNITLGGFMKLKEVLIYIFLIAAFAGCHIEQPNNIPVIGGSLNIPIGDSSMTVQKAIDTYNSKFSGINLYIENDSIFMQSDTAIYSSSKSTRDSLEFYLGISKSMPDKIDTIKTVFHTELRNFEGVVHIKGNCPGPDTFVGKVNYSLTLLNGDTTLYDSLMISLPPGDFDTTISKNFNNFNLGGYKMTIEGYSINGSATFDSVWGYTKSGFDAYINGDTLYTVEIPFSISDDMRKAFNPDSLDTPNFKINYINIAAVLWNHLPIGVDYNIYVMNSTKTDTFYLADSLLPPQIDSNGYAISDTLSELDLKIDSTIANVFNDTSGIYLIEANTPAIGKIFVRPSDYLRFHGHITINYWINANDTIQ